MSTDLQDVATRARDFLVANGRDLEAAVVELVWFEGDPQAVVDGLVGYQNADGGFGRGLEADIGAPESNPFAACLALTYLRGLPDAVAGPTRARLGVWLVDNQDEDGDWHFSEATRAGSLAPWFASWTFPSLNPACNIAGLAAVQGLATPLMLERVGALFREKASLAVVRNGEYYDLTPYAEYSLTGTLPTEYQDALVDTILRWARDDRFEDAEHFFNLALRGAPSVAARMPREVVHAYVERALTDQQDDGGWPSPYDEKWRPAATAATLEGIARATGRL
jgi:hypothetical protein